MPKGKKPPFRELPGLEAHGHLSVTHPRTWLTALLAKTKAALSFEPPRVVPKHPVKWQELSTLGTPAGCDYSKPPEHRTAVPFVLFDPAAIKTMLNGVCELQTVDVVVLPNMETPVTLRGPNEPTLFLVLLTKIKGEVSDLAPKPFAL